jgi:glycosyltransferase involved in cell wall biosynthesis
MPLVSITIPTYNAAKTLTLAIASVFAQTIDDWECVIVDDGSTDNTSELLGRLSDKRIKYHKLEKNCGRAVARQKALELSKGKYLCILDADDWMYPDKLKKQVEFLESNKDVVLVSTPMVLTGVENKPFGVQGLSSPRKVRNYCLERFTVSLSVFHPSSMLRMDIAKQFKYRPNMVSTEDLDYLIRLLLKRKYALLAEPLHVYREPGFTSTQRLLEGYRYADTMLIGFSREFPITVSFLRVGFLIKKTMIRSLSLLGLGGIIYHRHYQQLTEKDNAAYWANLQRIQSIALKLFGL